MRTALMMSVKSIAVVHNEKHQKTLVGILKKYIVDDLVANGNSSKFAPPDLNDKLGEAKPARLLKWEGQRKRQGEVTEEPETNREAKRQNLADQCEAMLDSLETATVTPSKPKKDTPKKVEKAEAGAKGDDKKDPKPEDSKKDTPKKGDDKKAEAGAKSDDKKGESAGASGSGGPATGGPHADLQALLSKWAT